MESPYSSMMRLLNIRKATPTYSQGIIAMIILDYRVPCICRYRAPQKLSQCLRSVLSLHNETLNIWTHLLGFLTFFSLLLWDWWSPPSKVTWQDLAVILTIITCYQLCMILSAIFHTFTAHSQEASEFCLLMDLAGIGASITASYISGGFSLVCSDRD